ncbi:2,3-diaminopropionate biosynthesis protein SbnB [Micromonospora sp. AKA38]|uniref:2,3-diaminopropionate biosynthesis protein SbnB n=1 Tax=Micromonospora sp. AKA38 TaxID=2733861 RepID=UPI0022C62A19|nr:2,3-diaminopropionate biosynthesis protein SbnB [Micromonospora sp. AKA38]GHJ15490.1 hypothetical protein TPA0908_34850 [Micromonospora sp. AKA38]
MFEFNVVPGDVVSEILAADLDRVRSIVADTYAAHHADLVINPDSYFLRFPDRPDSRIIALPAKLGGVHRAVGIKWISSFPANVGRGIPRASAVLILNDCETGYPIACLEAGGISAARTAASAALAGQVLVPPGARTYAFVGAGVIARTIFDHLRAAGLPMSEALCHDKDARSLDSFAEHIRQRGPATVRRTDLTTALTADVVVFATTAPTPYVSADTRLRPDQIVLNISLRDLPPEVIVSANNVLDDVEHCMKADTSPHLAEQMTHGRNFVTGTLQQVIRGEARTLPDRATIFSPFGLGVLDVALGSYVLTTAMTAGRAIPIPRFFGQTERWPAPSLTRIAAQEEVMQ